MTVLGGTMQRNPWVMGGAVFMFLLMMIPGSLFLRSEWLNRAGVQQRQPLARLGYCGSDQASPCVVSFSVDTDGQMIVTIRTESSFPSFYLKIRHNKGENLYPCQLAKGFQNHVFCKGARLPLGETFQFYLISLYGETTLAQGNFSIIGLALGTPDIFSLPTLEAALSPSVTMTPTATLPTGPATPIGVTPTPTTPAYPNPTVYPNP